MSSVSGTEYVLFQQLSFALLCVSLLSYCGFQSSEVQHTV